MMISDNLHDWMIIKMTTALVTQMTEYDHHVAIKWPFLCFETDNSSRRIKRLVFNPSSIKTGRFI